MGSDFYFVKILRINENVQLLAPYFLQSNSLCPCFIKKKKAIKL